MQRFLKYFLIFGLAMTVAACSTATKKEEGEGAPIAAEGEGKMMDPLSDPSSPLATRVIYFDFDSSVIKAEFKDVIIAHGNYLAGHPEAAVVLEGHADERGTREYNIALGERRAKAVEKLLTVQGVAPNQIQVISFGEERPVALGHDESAWSLNRRVEILYSGR